jgi:hypothetical protein
MILCCQIRFLNEANICLSAQAVLRRQVHIAVDWLNLGFVKWQGRWGWRRRCYWLANSDDDEKFNEIARIVGVELRTYAG